MTDEILNMMEERRKYKRSENQYREIDKEIKRKCTEEKEKWLNTMCIEIESNRNTDSRKLHSKIKEIAGKRKNTFSSSGCLKAKDGTRIIEKEETIKRSSFQLPLATTMQCVSVWLSTTMQCVFVAALLSSYHLRLISKSGMAIF